MSEPVQPTESRPLTEGEAFWLFLCCAINEVYMVRGERLKAMCDQIDRAESNSRAAP